jgi:Mycothiol maleylpyruvate isomerase N-terminal domain
MPACGECGYDFAEDSVRLAERCSAFSAGISDVLHTTAPEVLLRRSEPSTWSPLEYAAHVSEAVPWYVGRVQKVLGEAEARLTAFDWDQAASDGNYRQRDVETVTSDLRRACAALAELARSVSEEDLARTGIGSDGTPRTVQVLLARAGHELAHHELDIRRGVAAATTSTPAPPPPR